MGEQLSLMDVALPEGDYDSKLFVRGHVTITEAGFTASHTASWVSLGTWFNAAPVGWWNQRFGIRCVNLLLSGQGIARIASLDASGAVTYSPEFTLDGSWEQTFNLNSGTLFMWIDLRADKDIASLSQYSWVTVATTPISPSQRITAVVPTYKREDDALDQVTYLAAEDIVGRVVLVDQGDSIAQHPRCASLREELADKFVLIEQGNFGGSGGYARGMLESLKWPQDAVLLLDDDAHIHAEALRRALALSRIAGGKAVIGTGLVSAETGVHLEALAEGINPKTFQWGPTDGLEEGTDLTQLGPSQWSFAQPNARHDYCGWWGCLLPAGAVSDLGLSARFFIKWDDAEYGVRARNAGYSINTVPGISVWHPTWAAKQTSASWSSLLMHRNRFAVAAHSRASRGIIRDSLAHQVKHVLSAQYDTAELWISAVEQFAAGPDWLSEPMEGSRDRAQQVLDDFRSVLGEETSTPETGSTPLSRVDFILAVLALTGVPVLGKRTRTVAVIDYTWRQSIGVGATQVRDSESNRVVRSLVHRPAVARKQLRRIVWQHISLALRWPKLSRAYSARAFGSFESWAEELGSRPLHAEDATS